MSSCRQRSCGLSASMNAWENTVTAELQCAGTMRSGDLHNCTQFDVILAGRARLVTYVSLWVAAAQRHLHSVVVLDHLEPMCSLLSRESCRTQS